MITSNYKAVIILSVFHTYFSNGQCRGLIFNPANETKKLLTRYGFLHRNKPNGFELYTTTPGPLPSYLESIMKTTRQESLEFLVSTADTLFYNYTSLPDNFKGFIYSNKKTQPDNEKETLCLLPENAQEPAGTLAKITLYFEDVIQLIAKGKTASYTIHFEARKTQWQYFIVSRGARAVNNLTVKHREAITFTGPDKVTIPSGEQALLFTADTLLPIMEAPVYKFDLVNNTEKKSGITPSATIIYKGLPNPGPENIGRSATVNHLSSPMYVYI